MLLLLLSLLLYIYISRLIYRKKSLQIIITYIRVRTCANAYIGTRIYIYTYIYIHTHIYIYIFIYIYIYIEIFVSARTHESCFREWNEINDERCDNQIRTCQQSKRREWQTILLCEPFAAGNVATICIRVRLFGG